MLRLFLLLALAGAAAAQTVPEGAVLEGVITDTASGGGVAGAAVRVEGTGRGAGADREGRYRRAGLEAGPVEVVVTAVGYSGARRAVVLEAGRAVRLDVALVPVRLALGEVAVEAASSLTGAGGAGTVPGSTTVLEAAALRRFADTDVLRVLSDVPGVTVQEEDGYGLRPNIGIRGTVSDRSSGVTLMEDGVLIAPAPYAAPAAYYAPPIARMDGLEVRKGSAQIAYGPYTTGGAVNYVSAAPPSNGTAGVVEGRGGTDRARTGHARLGRGGLRVGGARLDVLAEGLWDGTDGFKRLARFADAAPTADALEGATGYDLWSAHGRARLRWTTRSAFHSVEIKATADGQTSDETYLGLAPGDFRAAPRARYVSTAGDEFTGAHRLGHLRYVGVVGDGVDVTATLYATRFDRDWRRLDAVTDGLGDDLDTDGDGLPDADLEVPLNRFIDDPVVFADELAVARGSGDPRLAEGTLVVTENDRRFGAEGLDLTAGVPLAETARVRAGLRFHRDRADRLQRADRYRVDVAALEGDAGPLRVVERGTPGDRGNRVDRAGAVAAYLEGDLQAPTPLGWLVLSPGVRVEHVRQDREDFGTADPGRAGAPTTRENAVTALIPGLGVRLDTGPVTVFGGLHRGFAPASSEPGVEAERSLNGELGARVARRAGGVPVSAQAVAFATAYDNLLGADVASSGGTGSGDLFNGGAARVVGLEVSADAEPVVGGVRVPLRLAYTATGARFEESFTSAFLPWGVVREGDRLPYVAPHALTVGAGLTTSRARLNVRAAYTAPTRDRAGQGPIPESARVDGRLVVDATAVVAVPAAGLPLRAVVAVRNLADAEYVASRRPAGLRPGLPRTVLVGLRAEF